MRLAMRWKRNFSLFTAIIIPLEKPFVNSFSEKIIKFSSKSRFPLWHKEFLNYKISLRHISLCKRHKNHYDKSRQNLPPHFLHKIFDEKSCKMDIYKFEAGVYNRIPDKATDPRRYLIPAQLAGFWRNINLMISERT